MALKKSYFVLAFFVTLSLFLSIVMASRLAGDKREELINQESQKAYNSLNEMQTFWIMSDTYGNDMACLAFSNKLQDLDKSLWNLGIRLDQYRAASEEFTKDKYYLEQKRNFNDNEVIYLMLLRKMKEACSYNQTIVLFFYRNAEDCSKCDDQSYVLTSINLDFDNLPKKEVSIFSFDADLNITTIRLLEQYYNVTEHPCVVVDDEVYCGIRDKSFLMNKICEENPTVQVCS